MKKSKKSGMILWGVLSALMLTLIYGQSMLPPQESGALSGSLVMYLKPILDPFDWFRPEEFHYFIRKAGHFTEYTLFSLFFALFCEMADWKNRIFPLFVCLLVAVSDEFLQSFTGRGSSVRDVVLDYSGSLFGFIIAWLVHRISCKRRMKHEA